MWIVMITVTDIRGFCVDVIENELYALSDSTASLLDEFCWKAVDEVSSLTASL
jgi:hypothetical protein